jgi:hypothetical protein
MVGWTIGNLEGRERIVVGRNKEKIQGKFKRV